MSLAEQALGTHCPHCGAEQPGARGARPPIGPPFSVCTGCSEFISRPLFNEWALLSLSTQLGQLALAGVRIFVFGTVPAVLYAGFMLSAGEAVDPGAATLVVALGVTAAGAWVGFRSVDEITRSRRRMTDPMYLARLAEFAKASTTAVLDETRST